MYNMNDIERKVFNMYHSGDIQKAINHTKLIDYHTPILVDSKFQHEWLSTDELKNKCGIYCGENYNQSMPWLFLIHDGELKIIPLAPIVHSISYDVLDYKNLVCIDNGSNEQPTYIHINNMRFMVSLFLRDDAYLEHVVIYNYLLSGKIKNYLFQLEDESNFKIDYMECYNDLRKYDYVWIKDTFGIPNIIEIRPQEFLYWKVSHAAIASQHRKSADGNKMAWLPVLRWKN